MLVLMGVESWPEPTEQPADGSTLREYDVDADAYARWREARNAYLSARAALVGQLERQGWRPRAGGYIDVVCTAPPAGPDEPAPVFVEVEDDQGQSFQAGEWLEKPDGTWALRIRR